MSSSSDVSTVIQDYVTNENIKLNKGQSVNLIQKINNENCLIQIISSEQQNVEVIVPISIIRIANNKQSKLILQSQISSIQNEDIYSKAAKSGNQIQLS